jgi:hypothetical protein
MLVPMPAATDETIGLPPSMKIGRLPGHHSQGTVRSLTSHTPWEAGAPDAGAAAAVASARASWRRPRARPVVVRFSWAYPPSAQRA